MCHVGIMQDIRISDPSHIVGNVMYGLNFLPRGSRLLRVLKGGSLVVLSLKATAEVYSTCLEIRLAKSIAISKAKNIFLCEGFLGSNKPCTLYGLVLVDSPT